MGVSDSFKDKTVVLAGAGCVAGAALARHYAGAGARVIAIDRDERAAIRVAEADPGRIDPLRLDVMDSQQRLRFAEIWGDEPIHALVHLQPLRHGGARANVIEAVLSLSDLLQPALRAGQGKTVILFDRLSSGAALTEQAFDPSLQGLAALLDQATGAPELAVNALQLDRPMPDAPFLSNAALWLTAPGGAPVRGTVLRLAAGSGG